MSFAHAAEWRIEPGLSAEERYTDNVGLAPAPQRQSDWVTTITPAVSVAAIGPRLRFNGVYAPEAVFYARGGYADDVYQRGTAKGWAELAEQLLFVDFGGGVDQYNASLLAPQADSNANVTGNRTTVSSYFASPYLRRDIGTEARVEARFTGSAVNSDDETLLSNSTANRIDLRANSGPAYRLLTWDAELAREDIRYDEERDDTLIEQAGANVKRLITPTVGLLGKGGYDRYRIGRPGESLDGAAWGLGFDWTPSSRTRFAAMAGRRFYGDDYMLDASHRTRRTMFGLGYNQIVTTTRSQFFAPDASNTAGYLNTLFAAQFPDPVAREKAVQEYISRTAIPPGLSGPTNFFSSELFLSRRWQASMGLLGVRNVVIASLFREDREVLGSAAPSPLAGDFATSNAVLQTGVSFQWTWQLSGRYSWNMGAGRAISDFTDTSREDRLGYVSLGLARQFAPKLLGSLNYRWQDSDSNAADGNYTENAVFATITQRF